MKVAFHSSDCLRITLSILLLLLLGVRSLHNEGHLGDERCHLLQLLFAAAEFGCQGSADRPHTFSCNFVKGASLQNVLCGLFFLASW